MKPAWRLLVAVGLGSVTVAASAADWPQWRGPQRNGISRETGLLKEWPAGGPKLLWQAKDIGFGYGTPAVVGERLYVISNRGSDNEFLEARAIKDGAPVWTAGVGNPDQMPAYPGSRSTPTGFLSAHAQRPGDVGFPYGDLKEVTLQGKVVSLGEEMSRKYGARVAGAGPEKQWALALPEGQLYTFLDNESYRKLLAANLASKAVEVKARHFPRSMLLEVTAYKEIAAETLKRRFFCDVCTIYTEDFGPCVCCGKEMELISEPKTR